MSPPCASTIFEGDNGGATSTGVSGTEIRVAIPTYWNAGQDRSDQVILALFDHLNRSFELYGRRLVPVFVNVGWDEMPTGPKLHAWGADIASREIFAALTGYSEENTSTSQSGLVQELARRGVVSVIRGAGIGWSDRQVFDLNHPYIWSVWPSLEATMANVGDFVCRSLAGRPAVHAKDAALHGETRKVGLLVASWNTPYRVNDLTQALDACGQEWVKVDWTDRTDAANLQTGLARLQAAGATTVVFFGERGIPFSRVTRAANSMGFGPEWIVPDSPKTYMDDLCVDDGSAPACIMVAASRKLLPLQARPWFGAIQAALPELITNPGNDFWMPFQYGESLYDSLMTLASGVQGAGPRLTPQTFAAALMSMQFPNPGAGQAPFWQPAAGFGPGDHSFFDDYAVAWWSPTAEPLAYDGAGGPDGSWCYVNQGARFSIGKFTPAIDEQLFNPSAPCR